MTDEQIAVAALDFKRHFGDDQVSVKTDVLNGEEVIVIENKIKRAIYSTKPELIKVLNLRGEE